MKHLLLSLASCLTGLLATGCSPYQLAETDNDTEPDTTVSSTQEQGQLALQVRGTDNSPITSPITVCLFDDQRCVHQTQLENTDTPYRFQTRQGSYHLTAFAGLTDAYSFPKDFTYESFLTLPSDLYSTTPLLAGRSDVQLSKDTQITVQLSPAMSSVQATLHQVPQDATEVTLHLSPVSSAYSFSGKYKNDQQTCRAACQRETDQWTVPTLYLLPSESTYTLLSVQVTTPAGVETQSYSLPNALEAGQPYRLKGNLSDNKMTLEGTFSVEGWKPVTEIEFTFEGGSATLPDDPSTTFTVTRLPEPGEVWNGCYVWETEDAEDGGRDLLLLSPASFSCQAAQGATELADYTVNGIGNWRTFSKDEAKRFRSRFGETMSQLMALNDQLGRHGLAAIIAGEDDRYLCENCEYSFTMCPTKSGSITKAGSQKTYHLRAVKLVRVRLQE
ncbi:MAG: FimB/Mfa2 family fimbrial subunit [Bacteroidales bacterium]|nr:FimB/Mfa2 family fimbrial subunit [Bacteroidales bacterium]